MLRLGLSLLLFLGLSVYALTALHINLALLFNPVALLWVLGSLCWALSALPSHSWHLGKKVMVGQATSAEYQRILAQIEGIGQALLWGAVTGALIGLIPLLGGWHSDLGSTVLAPVYALGLRYGLLMPMTLYLQQRALQA